MLSEEVTGEKWTKLLGHAPQWRTRYAENIFLRIENACIVASFAHTPIFQNGEVVIAVIDATRRTITVTLPKGNFPAFRPFENIDILRRANRPGARLVDLGNLGKLRLNERDCRVRIRD